ncbi:MAG: hypothetical protein PHP32_01245 [Candidatus Izemoplasmatales bacterium]|nr:hypothetical protein [Candidatus Izemoplasmatales bacterium]
MFSWICLASLSLWNRRYRITMGILLILSLGWLVMSSRVFSPPQERILFAEMWIPSFHQDAMLYAKFVFPLWSILAFGWLDSAEAQSLDLMIRIHRFPRWPHYWIRIMFVMGQVLWVIGWYMLVYAGLLKIGYSSFSMAMWHREEVILLLIICFWYGALSLWITILVKHISSVFIPMLLYWSQIYWFQSSWIPSSWKQVLQSIFPSLEISLSPEWRIQLILSCITIMVYLTISWLAMTLRYSPKSSSKSVQM